MITININKAKEIHRNAIRKAREPLLQKLDVDFQRALETGQDTSAIVQQKQVLRDITQHPDLEAAQTTDEIRAFWPEVLGPKL